jgi:hypothetical protein
MKTLPLITRQTLGDAFIASRKDGTSKGTLFLIRGDQTTICHGYRVVKEILIGDVFWLRNQQNELIALQEGDIIQYDDGTTN